MVSTKKQTSEQVSNLEMKSIFCKLQMVGGMLTGEHPSKFNQN